MTVHDGGRALREMPRIPSDVGTDSESGRGTAIRMTKRLAAPPGGDGQRWRL